MLLDFVLVVSALCVGGSAGWFLRNYFSSSAVEATTDPPTELKAAREILGRLHHVAKNIALDVTRHSSRIEEVSLALQDIDDQDGAVVAEAVTQLLEANAGMRKQLGTAERRLQEQAQIIESQSQEARTDALTGLANRRAFDTELGEVIAQSRESNLPVHLLLVDVDFFKRVNDTYGHQAGDEVLRGVADSIRSQCNESTLPTRFGGEEFAVILAGEDRQAAETLASNIRGDIEAAVFPYHDLDLSVTVSVGIAILGKAGDSQQLIERSDEALYISKEAGRNCIHIHDGANIVRVGRSEPITPDSAEPADTSSKADTPDPSPARSSWSKDLLGALTPRENFLDDVDRRIAEHRRGGAPLAVILLQVDHLDDILREQGTKEALQVLRLASRCVQGVMREMDLLGRFEQHTLSLLLPGSKLDGARSVARRLHEKISRIPCEKYGFDRVTISLGIAEIGENDSSEQLLVRAEEGLDAVCEGGGNGTCYHDGYRAIPVDADEVIA